MGIFDMFGNKSITSGMNEQQQQAIKDQLGNNLGNKVISGTQQTVGDDYNNNEVTNDSLQTNPGDDKEWNEKTQALIQKQQDFIKWENEQRLNFAERNIQLEQKYALKFMKSYMSELKALGINPIFGMNGKMMPSVTPTGGGTASSGTSGLSVYQQDTAKQISKEMGIVGEILQSLGLIANIAGIVSTHKLGKGKLDILKNMNKARK